MSFKVRLSDTVVVEVDSEQELRTILSVAGISGVSAVTPVHGRNPVRRAAVATPDSVSDRLAAFYDRIHSVEQKKVLHVLAQFDDWLTDDQLRERVGAMKKSSLGAYMAALTRNAKAVDLRFDKHVMGKQKKWTADRKPFYRYRLLPEMRDLIRDRHPELSRQGQLPNIDKQVEEILSAKEAV